MANVFDQRLVEPSPIARRLLWHVLSIGRVTRDEPETHVGRDKAGVFLFWVVSGQGHLEVDQSCWELSVGPCCWLVDLARPRSYRPMEGSRLATAGFRFSGPGLDAWCESLGGGGEFLLPGQAEIIWLRRTLQQMLRTVTRRPVSYEWTLHESITRVLGQLLAARKVFVRPAAGEAPPKSVTKVLDAVLSDPARAWRAAELAELVGISYSGLRQLFRQSQQESLSEFLQRTRLDRARQLLSDDRLAVKEVARRLDFSSEFYFSQWFRRLTGLSPSLFRETLAD